MKGVLVISQDYTLGIDIGSTTVKIAVLDPACGIRFADYRRHHADIQGTLRGLVNDALARLGDVTVHPVITGSGGLTLATHLQVPFVQEVVSVSTALEKLAPKTDVAIELGGEDAKIIYFENGSIEQRMNGICAGGTGSFIDQMASLLQTDAAGLDRYARGYRSLYTIAARCGVFAKSDIQPLINEGATREDLAASIFQAVVNQTISGLACGKPIRGHVAFLGGPLHFLPELKAAFVRTLRLDAEHTIDLENSHLFAAMGSAMNAREDTHVPLSEMAERLSGKLHMEFEIGRMDPLFTTQEEYDEFRARHEKACVRRGDLAGYRGNCFLGIDAGSTTTKAAVVAEDGTLLYSFYENNNGSPLAATIKAIKEITEITKKEFDNTLNEINEEIKKEQLNDRSNEINQMNTINETLNTKCDFLNEELEIKEKELSHLIGKYTRLAERKEKILAFQQALSDTAKFLRNIHDENVIDFAHDDKFSIDNVLDVNGINANTVLKE